jgi:hypothetical protein
MRLDDENGEITRRSWICIAACAVFFCAIVAGGVIAIIVKLWMYLVTL